MNQTDKIKKIAESNPISLLMQGIFWWSQKEFLFIIVIAVSVAPFLIKFTYNKPDLLTYGLNIIIHSLALWGVVITVKALAEIEVEHAIVKFIENRGINYLQDLQGTNYDKSRRNLNNLSQDFVPNNQTQPPLGMIRLFRRICKEAKDRKFESSIYLVQPYREESFERVNEISNLQKIALRLGIFGTFIGLILAISQLGTFQIDNVNNDNFGELINQLFNNLYTSFSTSIAGLEVSIFLGFLLMVLRKKQKVYFRDMEDTTITMLSVARNSINNDEFLAEFRQVYNLVNELDNKIYDHAHQISTAIGEVENKIQSQTEHIQEGIDELVKSKDKLTDFLAQINKTEEEFIGKTQVEYKMIFEQLSETQKAFIDETQKIYELLSIKNISTQLRNGIIDAGNHVSKSIDNTEKTIESQTEEIQKGMNRLAEVQLEFEQFTNVISESQRQFINDIRSSYDIVLIKQMNDELKASINQTGESIDRGLELNSEKLSSTILELKQSLDNNSSLIHSILLKIQERKNKSWLNILKNSFFK